MAQDPHPTVRLTLLPEVAHPDHVQFGTRMTSVPVPEGLGTYEELFDELQGYTDEILGRLDAPVEAPYLQLMEVATAYLARALEIDMLILKAEHDDIVAKGSSLYRFRTGPLDRFETMARKMADLGSRRLTAEQMIAEERRNNSI